MSEIPTPPGPAAPGRSALWTALPGWGIAADLTPPELVKARQIVVLRGWIAVGLAGVVLVCGGGYYLAARDNDAAAADLATASDRTVSLQAEGRSYSDVVSIQNRITQIQGQVAQVMTGDIDVVALMDQLQTNLPENMKITQQAITISTAGAAGAAATGDGTDTSSGTRVGTVLMSGTGTTLDELSDYIDRLETIPGVVDVIPLSNTLTGEGGAGTEFSVSLAVTDTLFSHRFDVKG